MKRNGLAKICRASAWAVVGLMGLVGCGTGQKYYWGEYQTLLFRMYDQPAEAPAERQIDVLTKNIDQARGSGKPVAPGIYAHRGFMHLQAGHGDEALADFGRERELYPESAVMIDRMVASMTGKRPGGSGLDGTKPAASPPLPSETEKMPATETPSTGTPAKGTSATPKPAQKVVPKRSRP